jgi:HEAT repeat protein
MLPGATEATLPAAEQDYLTELLDPSPEVREDAAGSIEPVGIALEYLATIVTTDPSAEVRIAAAGTLEDSKDPRALEALILALQDEHPEVLVEVIDALGYAGNRSIITRLQPFLEHPDEDVRDAAESSIEQLN